MRTRYYDLYRSVGSAKGAVCLTHTRGLSWNLSKEGHLQTCAVYVYPGFQMMSGRANTRLATSSIDSIWLGERTFRVVLGEDRRAQK